MSHKGTKISVVTDNGDTREYETDEGCSWFVMAKGEDGVMRGSSYMSQDDRFELILELSTSIRDKEVLSSISKWFSLLANADGQLLFAASCLLAEKAARTGVGDVG